MQENLFFWLDISNKLDQIGFWIIKITQDGHLNFEEILNKFQFFIKEEYSDQNIDFLERNGRLVFWLFLNQLLMVRALILIQK